MAAQVCLCELLLFSFSWLVENESCWVAEGDLDLPAATSQVLGLQICASHPALTALANYSWQVESSSSFFFLKHQLPRRRTFLCIKALSADVPFMTACRGCGIVHTLVCGLLPGVGLPFGPRALALLLMPVSM